MGKEKMKKYLLDEIKRKKEQRDNLNKAIIESDNKEERAQIGETLKKLSEEIKQADDALAEMDSEDDTGSDGGDGGDGMAEGRGAKPSGATFNPMASYAQNGALHLLHSYCL